jgi:hypothetical protein
VRPIRNRLARTAAIAALLLAAFVSQGTSVLADEVDVLASPDDGGGVLHWSPDDGGGILTNSP